MTVIEHATGLWKRAEREISELKQKAKRYHICRCGVDNREVAVADLGDSYAVVHVAGMLMTRIAVRKASVDEMIGEIARMLEEDHMRLFVIMDDMRRAMRDLSACKCENELCQEVSEAFSQALGVWQILRAGGNE